MSIIEFPSVQSPLGPDELLTYEEAAAFMRVNVRTIKRYVARGELETVGRPPKVFVVKQSIAAFQQRTRRGGQGEGGHDAAA